MPQLIGVKTVSDTVLEYDGYRYEKTTGEMQEGDILRHDVHGYGFLPRGAFYLAFFERGYVRVSDEDGAHLNIQGDADFSVFRRVAASTIATTLTEKRAELERLQAEIAELEAQEAEERRINKGDWVRTDAEDIGRVIEIDPSSIPVYVNSVLGDSGWYHEDEVEKITPAEARAALISQIDAMFDGEEAITSEA